MPQVASLSETPACPLSLVVAGGPPRPSLLACSRDLVPVGASASRSPLCGDTSHAGLGLYPKDLVAPGPPLSDPVSCLVMFQGSGG